MQCRKCNPLIKGFTVHYHNHYTYTWHPIHFFGRNFILINRRSFIFAPRTLRFDWYEGTLIALSETWYLHARLLSWLVGVYLRSTVRSMVRSTLWIHGNLQFKILTFLLTLVILVDYLSTGNESFQSSSFNTTRFQQHIKSLTRPKPLSDSPRSRPQNHDLLFHSKTRAIIFGPRLPWTARRHGRFVWGLRGDFWEGFDHVTLGILRHFSRSIYHNNLNGGVNQWIFKITQTIWLWVYWPSTMVSRAWIIWNWFLGNKVGTRSSI